MNEAHWFQSMSGFAGHFYRNYPRVELDAILMLVVNQVSASVLVFDVALLLWLCAVILLRCAVCVLVG